MVQAHAHQQYSNMLRQLPCCQASVLLVEGGDSAACMRPHAHGAGWCHDAGLCLVMYTTGLLMLPAVYLCRTDFSCCAKEHSYSYDSRRDSIGDVGFTDKVSSCDWEISLHRSWVNTDGLAPVSSTNFVGAQTDPWTPYMTDDSEWPTILHCPPLQLHNDHAVRCYGLLYCQLTQQGG